MPAGGIIWLVIMAAGLIAGVVSGIVTARDRRKNPPPANPFITEDIPLVQQPATVGQKQIEKRMTGTYLSPGHWLAHVVRFELADGVGLPLMVPAEVYDGLSPGVRGTLITQAGNFVGFEVDREV